MSPSRAFSPWVGAHPFATQSPAAGSNLVGNPKPVLKAGIAIAAMLILMVPLITVTADARGGGGGGGGGRGGGGFGGGHIGGFGGGAGGRIGGFGGSHIGGFSGGRGGVGHIGGIGGGISGRVGGFGSHIGGSSGRIGGLGISSRGAGPGLGARSLGGPRIGSVGTGARSLAGSRPGISAARLNGPGNRLVGVSGRNFAVAGSVRGAGLGRGVFGNRAIGNVALRSQFASARFHGRFFGSRWPWWRGGLVVGWIGPVFWPYAYYDFFDYVYWPYAYDDFWPYAYDDVYYGIYGNYAYAGGGVAAPGRNAGSAPRRTAKASGGSERRPAEVCSDNASDLTDWPIERISEVVQPTDAQRSALDELRAANARAVDILKAGCPKDLPSTPTGRLTAMESRLQVMLQAVQTVRPALDRFYQSLNDEQKARFNAVSPGSDSAAGDDQRDLSKFCDERTPGVTDLPIDRIAQAVQPTQVQRAALDELKDASTKAADALKANCPGYQALTPTGRVEAMEKRLQATLGAVRTVQPALTKFYDGLSDEQKARFNSLRSSSRPVG
jgi:hypothetical protein